MDLFFLLVTLAFFAASAWLCTVFERVRNRK
jgi:hypothetical protein